MKLVLINPHIKYTVLDTRFRKSLLLGLGFKATYAKNHSNCDVEVIEFGLQNISEKEVLSKR